MKTFTSYLLSFAMFSCMVLISAPLAAQNIGIGTTSPTSRLEIIGAGTTNSSSTLNVLDSNANSLFYIQDDLRIGIGTTNPHPAAVLDINSNESGLLLPRMTTTQRDNINNPATGLMVYNLTTNCINVFMGQWRELCGDCGFGDPVAGAQTPVCQGDTIELTATAISGATYNWTGPNGFTSTDQNPVIPAADSTNSGVYYVTAELNGCVSDADTVSITIDNAVAAPMAYGDTLVCEGDTLHLYATGDSSSNFTWTGPNGFTANVQDTFIYPATAADSGLYVLSAGSCSAGNDTLQVAIQPTLNGWDYKQPVTIDNTNNSDTLTDYEVKVTIDHASLVGGGFALANGNDLRFTDSDGITQLPYYIESGLNTSNCIVWVRVPYIPANGSIDIYMYYGNSGAAAASNPNTTFHIYDDFNRANSTTVGNGWVEQDGGFAIVSNQLQKNASGGGSLTQTGFDDLGYEIQFYGMTYSSGFGNLQYRYQHFIGVKADNDNNQNGYGIKVGRSDENFNNSKVSRMDNGTQVDYISSNSQFTNSVSGIVQIKKDGSIDCRLGLNGANPASGQLFSFGPHTPNASGDNFKIFYNFGTSYTQWKPNLDKIVVRKYCEPEPAATVGGQQAGCVTLGTTPPQPVVPTPPIAYGDTAVCESDSLNLYATADTASSWTWTGPNGFSSSDQNPSIANFTNANAGDYIVYINGDPSLADTITVGANGLAGWSFTEPVTIDNSSNNNTLTDYQVKVIFDHQSLVNAGQSDANGNDLRFTEVGSQTLLPYWIEGGTNTPNCTTWVRVPTIPANTTYTLNMHFGNGSAAPYSNGDSTFLLFDHFDSFNSNKWNAWANTSINNSVVTINPPNNSNQAIMSNDQFSGGLAAEFRWKYNTGEGFNNLHVGFSDQFDGKRLINGDNVVATIVSGPGYTNLETIRSKNPSMQYSIAMGSRQENTWKRYSIYRDGPLFGNVDVLGSYDADGDTSITPTVTTRFGFSGKYNDDFLDVDWVGIRNFSYPDPSATVPLTGCVTAGSVPPPDTTANNNTAAWYNPNWQYRKKFTVLAPKVDATVNDFPVYLDLADFGSDFFSHVKTDGGDIRITKADGTTELAREVVNINTGSETGEVHFLADSLYGSTNTEFFIYYGNATANDYADSDTYGTYNVWGSNYVIVAHLGESGGSATDATVNNNNGSFVNNLPYQSPGKLGFAQEFETAGGGDYVNFGDIDPNSSGFTIQIWENWKSGSATGRYTMAAKGNVWDNGNGFGTHGTPPEAHFRLQAYNSAASVTYAAENSWGLVHFTYDGSTARGYVNGQFQDSANRNYSQNNSPLVLGWRGSGTDDYWKGHLDEFRMSSIALPEDWISTEYNNQSSPSSFYTVGIQQTP